MVNTANKLNNWDRFGIGQRNNHYPTVVSSIWEMLHDTLPTMINNNTDNSNSMFNNPQNYVNNCVSMCQTVQENNHINIRKTSNSRNQPNEPLIIIENIRPKCLLHFDNLNQNNNYISNSHPSTSGGKSSGKLSLFFMQSSLSSFGANSIGSTASAANSQSSSSSLSNVQSQSDMIKKTCIESSKHILTHNGLIINHPTLKLITTTSYDYFEPIEKQNLQSLEFFLQLESKNRANNAQYFDLVLKVFFQIILKISIHFFI